MTFEVRSACAEDAEGISRVILGALRETNAKDYPPDVIDRVEKSFAPDALVDLMARRRVFVATVGARIVGTASLEGAVARTMFVAPEMQGRGVGRLLMTQIERAARDAGVDTLSVPSSVTAEGFYARLGFVAVRERFHGEERTIVMERMLEERAGPGGDAGSVDP